MRQLKVTIPAFRTRELEVPEVAVTPVRAGLCRAGAPQSEDHRQLLCWETSVPAPSSGHSHRPHQRLCLKVASKLGAPLWVPSLTIFRGY